MFTERSQQTKSPVRSALATVALLLASMLTLGGGCEGTDPESPSPEEPAPQDDAPEDDTVDE